MRHEGPDFSLTPPRDGYAWWYVDAMSDDGRNGLTIIAFIGSVFSPYYKWARRKGPADPFDHCAINVALYGSPRRWAMTERGAGDLKRNQDRFRVGPSEMRWERDELIISISERCAPIPMALRGEVRLRPRTMFGETFALDLERRHRWRPIAPCCDVSLEMESPKLRWRGTGYLDHNHGDEPLEAAFAQWDWSRAHSGLDTIIHYDAELRSGAKRNLALRLRRNGAIEHFEAPPMRPLPLTLWRVDRFARCDEQNRPEVVSTLEDTPFYARSAIRHRIAGEDLTGFHERLRLDRFCAPIVQMMLPFRMPRIIGARAAPPQDAPPPVAP